MLERNKVSMVVFSYNQQEFVHNSIMSVLNQDIDGIEVILSDDASTDSTFDLMREYSEKYNGDKRIVLNRNEKNLGRIGHVNRIFEIATGDLIIINSGDDISEPSRAAKFLERFQEKNPLMLNSAVRKMNLDGSLTGEVWDPGARVQKLGPRKAAIATSLCNGASCAWSREMFDIFGPITEQDAYGDLVFSFRAILAGRLEHLDEPLLQYRLGGISTASPQSREARREKRVKRRMTQLAVLRQRRADVERFSPSLSKLKGILDSEISKYESSLGKGV